MLTPAPPAPVRPSSAPKRSMAAKIMITASFLNVIAGGRVTCVFRASQIFAGAFGYAGKPPALFVWYEYSTLRGQKKDPIPFAYRKRNRVL